MAHSFRTASHHKIICRPFMRMRRLFIILFAFSPALFLFPLFVAAKDASLPGDQTVKEIEHLNKEALRLFAMAKREEAVALWKKADGLALNAKVTGPAHCEVLHNLGQAYFRLGSEYYPLAETYLNRVVDIDPDRWDTYMIQGDLCYDDRQTDCAIGNYDLSLRLNPDHKRAGLLRSRMEGLAQSRNNSLFYGERAALSQRKYVYTYLMEDDNQYYYFYVTYSKESSLARIDIVRHGEKRIYQTFKYEDFGCGPTPGGEGLLQDADFKAHGRKDLKLLCMHADGSRAGYLYYVYSRKKGMFIPFDGGMLPDAIPGPDVLEIRIFDIYGDDGQLYVESFYRIADGKLVLLKEVKQNETALRDGKRFYKRIIRERSQDAMAVVSEALIEPAGK